MTRTDPDYVPLTVANRVLGGPMGRLFRHLREETRQSLYVADMNVALRYLEEGNSAQALALLTRHRPAAGLANRVTAMGAPGKGDPRKVVLAALLGNAGIAVAKRASDAALARDAQDT